MTAKRTLNLRSEVLTELANDELAAIVGADAVTLFSGCYGICPSRPNISCNPPCGEMTH